MVVIGYSIGDQILASPRSKGHSFSAAVSKINANNYLEINNHTGFNLNSDFTIECWVYMPAYISDSVLCSNKSTTSNRGWTFKVRGDHKLSFQMFGDVNYTITSTRTINNNNWVHVAVTKKLNTLNLFVNGVKTSDLRKVSSFNNASTEKLRIGINTNNTNQFIGYMSDLRITKGVARYIDNFVLPIKKFNQPDEYFNSVSLLLYFDDTGLIDSSKFKHPITKSGVVEISNLENLNGGYFSGTGSISKISIYNHGYGYDEIPSLQIYSKGFGANLLPLSDNIGQIESIEIIEPFIDSSVENTPQITVISKNGTGANLAPKINSVFNENPTWKTMEGVLGLNSTLLDSHYYQQFSYYTHSSIPRKESDSVIDEWCHPTGFVRFSILDISFSSNISTTNTNFGGDFYLDTVKKIYDIDESLMFNSIYNIHWFEELGYENYISWVNSYNWIPPEHISDPKYYLNQALDICPIVKYRTTVDNNLLVNPQSGLNWYKECIDNFHTPIEAFDDMICNDNILSNDPITLSRKRVSDNSLTMSRTLDSEITSLVTTKYFNYFQFWSESTFSLTIDF